MNIAKRIKIFACVAPLFLTACEHIPQEYVSWLPWASRETPTHTVPQEVQNLAQQHERESVGDILGQAEFAEIEIAAEPILPTLPSLPRLRDDDENDGVSAGEVASADADVGVGAVAEEDASEAARVAAEVGLTPADTVAGYVPRYLIAAEIAARAAAFTPSVSSEPLRVFVLDDVVGNFKDRRDLNIGLRVELFYRAGELGDEINFKRRALSLFASNSLGRYEFGNVTVQRIQIDLLSGFNNILERGSLDSVAVDMNVRL